MSAGAHHRKQPANALSSSLCWLRRSCTCCNCLWVTWCLSTTASSSLQMRCQACCVGPEYLAQVATAFGYLYASAPLLVAACKCVVKLAMMAQCILHKLQLLVHILVPAYLPAPLPAATCKCTDQAHSVGPKCLAQSKTPSAHCVACLLASTTDSSSLQMHCQAHCVGLEYLAQSETPSALCGACLLVSTTDSSSLQMHCQAHCVGTEYLAQSEIPSAIWWSVVPAYLSFTGAPRMLPQIPALPNKPPLQACQACSAVLLQLQHVATPAFSWLERFHASSSSFSQHY